MLLLETLENNDQSKIVIISIGRFFTACFKILARFSLFAAKLNNFLVVLKWRETWFNVLCVWLFKKQKN